MTNAPHPRRTKLMVIDDHAVVRQGLRQMLSQEDDLEVCCEAGTIADALATLEACAPDLAIIDISLGTENGLDLAKEISVRQPDAFILMLSMHSDKIYAERALRAGAQGYAMKEEPPEQLVFAIRAVRDGGVYVSEDLQAKWLRRASDTRGPVTGELADADSQA